MKYRQQEIVLAQFPFTDATGTKQRPVLILAQASTLHSDYLTMFISSQLSQAEPDDLLLDAAHPDFPVSGLIKPSVFKTLKLATLSESLILGLLGNLSGITYRSLINRLVQRLS